MQLNRPVLVQTLYSLHDLYIKIFFIILSTYDSMYTKSACIIIHGTWAQNENWYCPGGDFFEAVKKCNDEIKKVDEVISFSWSGKLGYSAQVEAAQNLATVINLYDVVVLVAHSHGATIGMIASQIMSKEMTAGNNFNKIAQFYSLGAPIRESFVTPNMMVIKRFYNLFSFGDFVQTVNGFYERVFSLRDRIVNVSIQFNSLHPSHAQLHHPVLGIWLLKIEEFFAEKQIGSFEQFDFSKPATISFTSSCYPVYSVQEDQELLLNLDKKIYELVKNAFFRGHKKF